jgi:hypothetical protein
MSNRFEHLIPKRLISYCQSVAPGSKRRSENFTHPEFLVQALNIKDRPTALFARCHVRAVFLSCRTYIVTEGDP